MTENVEAGILLKIVFFTDIFLIVEVLKWRLLLQIVWSACMKFEWKLEYI